MRSPPQPRTASASASTRPSRRSPSSVTATPCSPGSTYGRPSTASTTASARSAALAVRVTVLNPPAALLGTHDKLLTARILRRGGPPPPVDGAVVRGPLAVAPSAPVVVKPRFGSWGTGVVRCETRTTLHRTSRSSPPSRGSEPTARSCRSSFSRTPRPSPRGRRRRVVGAIEPRRGARRVADERRPRRARRSVRPPPGLRARAGGGAHLGATSSASTSSDGGRLTILELNGAVEFTPDTALTRPGRRPVRRGSVPRLRSAAALCARLSPSLVRHGPRCGRETPRHCPAELRQPSPRRPCYDCGRCYT